MRKEVRTVLMILPSPQDLVRENDKRVARMRGLRARVLSAPS